jgi:hypothetical protein
VKVEYDSLTDSWTAATKLLYALVRRQKELLEILFQIEDDWPWLCLRKLTVVHAKCLLHSLRATSWQNQH